MRTPRPLVVAMCLIAAGGLLSVRSIAAMEDTATDAVEIAATGVAFNLSDPEAGPGAPSGSSPLAYRGGLVLTSADDRFGGISGLLIRNEGNSIQAVTDTGHWLEADIIYDAEGRLAGISNAAMAPILDTQGRSIAGSKRLGDAEAMTRLPDGTIAVAFERTHRVWTYSLVADGYAAKAMPFDISPDLSDAVNNKGLEALASLPDGSLLALTEATMVAEDVIRGWRVTDTGTIDARLRRIPPFDLTDMALLPYGDLLTLERRFSTIGGVGAQMRHIAAADLVSDGVLEGPVVYRSSAGETVDNMEGLAVHETKDGTTHVFVVSDDNFNPLQRTLLLMFEWTGGTSGAGD